jgi:hypothetical protein
MRRIGTFFLKVRMRKILGRGSAVLHLSVLLGAGALAQSAPPEFSADIVSRDATGAQVGAIAKLHVANRKTRIEVPDASGGFFVSDADLGTALFVRSSQRIFFDARQSTPLTRIFVRVDPLEPCRQWQAAADLAGVAGTGDWHCEPMERAIVNNHETVEYRLAAPGQPPNYGWVEPTLNFPVKWQAPDGGSIALENIRIEAQPPGLFSIPSDYRKLDPQALLERIKHSDVWAEPAK